MNRADVVALIAALRNAPSPWDPAMVRHAADTLQSMLASLVELEAACLRLQECLVVEQCQHVNFQVAKTGRSARVMIDGEERLRIDDAQHIEFAYDLAAARSADHHSFTAPPMRWGEPDA
jgi:hypothetical protein